MPSPLPPPPPPARFTNYRYISKYNTFPSLFITQLSTSTAFPTPLHFVYLVHIIYPFRSWRLSNFLSFFISFFLSFFLSFFQLGRHAKSKFCSSAFSSSPARFLSSCPSSSLPVFIVSQTHTSTAKTWSLFRYVCMALLLACGFHCSCNCKVTQLQILCSLWCSAVSVAVQWLMPLSIMSCVRQCTDTGRVLLCSSQALQPNRGLVRPRSLATDPC